MSRSSSEAFDRIVHPGGCYLQNELIHCALDETHCQGLEFRSAWRMRESKDPAAQRCQRHHPDHVGMCTSKIDNFHCTGHESGCVISSKFVPNVPYCTIHFNHFPSPDLDTHLTLYGTCSDTCVWSIDDCPEEKPFTPASFSTSLGYDDLCTCDKVQTGACVFGANTDNESWMCAVSADACDPSSDFRSWQQVLAAGRDCRLCPNFDHGGRVSETEAVAVVAGVGVAVVLLPLLIVGLWCRRCGRRSVSGKLEKQIDSLGAGAIAIEEHDIS